MAGKAAGYRDTEAAVKLEREARPNGDDDRQALTAVDLRGWSRSSRVRMCLARQARDGWGGRYAVAIGTVSLRWNSAVQ